METSFWNLEFKSLYCDCVEEPANLLQVTCAHSIKTELIVYVRLSREHKMCDTQFLSFWTHSLFGEKKNSCAKKAIIQGSIWWLCTPFFINSVPSKKNYFCCYNQKSNIGEKTVKLGLKGQSLSIPDAHAVGKVGLPWFWHVVEAFMSQNVNSFPPNCWKIIQGLEGWTFRDGSFQSKQDNKLAEGWDSLVRSPPISPQAPACSMKRRFILLLSFPFQEESKSSWGQCGHQRLDEVSLSKETGSDPRRLGSLTGRQ